ncbi:MAG TPA: aspartate--ammonia ligase [Tissierellaceae bacterium]
MKKKITIRQTQEGIKFIKDTFERKLAENLNLIRVSAPLFVTKESGLNDNLTGVEKPVSFKLGKYDIDMEIVQSLAKWKRMALKKYNFEIGEGIYTDMNAIRPDEILDATHSIYVDQWDWEKVIDDKDRNLGYLKDTVRKIFKAFKDTEKELLEYLPGCLDEKLPNEITFLTSQELEDMYPNLSSEERENAACKQYKAIFVSHIGHKLNSGKPHDFRSPDYDDWNLNGDIIFWNETLNASLELSSMAIRVDKDSLLNQLNLTESNDRLKLDYHKKLIKGELPFTIGGGIGQSRICMFFLEKKHIGEVQASIWPKEVIEDCENEGVFLL